MNESVFLKATPTTKVKMLTLELLSDGEIHTRKEILRYIRTKEAEFRIEPLSAGCVTGGIHQAVNSSSCEKVDKATYRLKQVGARGTTTAENNQSSGQCSDEALSSRSAALCEDFIERLTEFSRGIEYVSASSAQLVLLDLMRDCIVDVRSWKEKFEKTETV